MTPSVTTEREISIDHASLLMEHLTDAGDNVCLWGKPGIGKTDVVRQLGKKRNRKVIEFHANLRETVDLRGIPAADLKAGTTRWLQPDELPREDRDGAEGYFFCDEFNTAGQQVQAALFGLTLEGRIGDYWLPKGWRVILAGNRVIDRAAAQRMPTAQRNRLAHLFICPDVDAWVKWANANGIAPEVVAFVRLRGLEVLHRMPNGDENCFVSPRSLTRAAKYVHAPMAIRRELFAANIGEGDASELDGFIRLYHSLGSLEDILRDPEHAKVPGPADQRYAVSTGLARLATRKNFSKVITYADRMPRENKMVVIHDATVRDASLKETSAYSNWAVANSDLIMQ